MLRSSNKRRAPALRRAFTLVELLVAVAIAALLIAIAIPALKINLRGQSIREAARQINSFIDEAKSQAVGSGRPFGIIIERDGNGIYGNPRRSYRLYHCEVPPPYCGDVLETPESTNPFYELGSRAYFADWATPPNPAWVTASASQYPNRGRGKAILTNASQRNVAAGDEISFDGSSVRYKIMKVTDLRPAGQPDIFLGIDYAHDTAGQPIANIPETDFPTSPVIPPGTAISPGHSFRVYRQPVKIAASYIELPRSAAIDLTWSGIGSSGVQFADFNSGAAPREQVLNPIMILFEPSGAVRHVVAPEPAGGRYLLEPRPIYEPIYLLVGRIDKVEDALTTATNWQDPNAEIPANLHDNDAMWIKINPANGSTLTVQNAGILDYLVPANAPWNGPDAVYVARQLARDSAGAGG